MPEEQITISREFYNESLESQKWLDALESAGVDNWSGYDYARELLKEESGAS